MGISLALKHGVTPVSTSAVAELLPRETVAVVHLPDFNRMRDQWHGTDIYKLYREPAMQDFLHKPLTQTPKADSAAQTIREIEQLGIKDGFIAITAIENNNHLFVAGFRYRGSEHDAEATIAKWRASAVGDQTAHPAVEYNQHHIEVSGEGVGLVATAYDHDWYFAANDVDQLKHLLDRADHRHAGTPADETLEQDENFRTASSHLPPDYAAMVYVQPKALSERVAALQAQKTGTPPSPSQTSLEQVHGICGAMRFDGGKIRDLWFIGTPKRNDATLKRSAAALGTTDTILYVATLLDPDRLSALSQIGNATPASRWLQKVFDVASRQGVTAADWNAAFDLELGSLADWPPPAHWPSMIATLGVKDYARAQKIVNVLPTAIDEDAGWNKIEKDGVQFFVMKSPFSWFAVAPTIALSKNLLVVGMDSRSVEDAIKRGEQSGGDMTQSSAYKKASRVLPEPTTAYAYVDLPTLYARLDASVRPMLMMAAMFMPAISANVDLNKLPAPEVVTRHLSPIVCSQRYDRDGYITESAGPITLTQLAVTVGVPITFWLSRHD